MPYDWKCHALVGFGLSAAAYPMASAWLPQADPLWVAVGSSVLAGAGKELLDSMGMGSPSLLDAAFTVLGGLGGALLGWLFIGRRP